FKIEFSLAEIFTNSTLSEMAKIVTRELDSRLPALHSTIEKAPREAETPLSFGQQRLWFLDRLEPGSAFYNLSPTLTLEGSLDFAAMEKSFAEVIRRHESLRTILPAIDGRPRQVVTSAPPFSLPYADLSDLQDSEKERTAYEFVSSHAVQPFDLSNGPLFNVKLLRLRETEHWIVVTMHHIVGDGWSIGILVREIAAIYEGLVSVRPVNLPEPSIQYVDFARWQRSRITGEVLEHLLDYWRSALKDAPHALELATDHPRPKIQTYRGQSVTFNFKPGLAEKLN